MKERVLEELDRAGGYVSGEAISAKLQRSRTAVWQWISELREAGYEIEASPRRGYRLLSRPDRLYPWEVQRHLKTELLGRELEYAPQVGSTNDVAKARAKEGAPEGLVVVAEEQLAGRGRRGRAWSSPFGLGVWSSTLLRPQITPFEAPQAALLAALAVARAIERCTSLSAEVKWPNDVLVQGKKVSGILVEMDAELERVRSLVVGIGINANLPAEALPEEARAFATSLLLATGRPVDRAALLARTLEELERVYFAWREGGFLPLLEEVRGRMGMLGSKVTVSGQSGSWIGRAVDVGGDGALLVERDGGEVVSVYAADVSVRAR